MHSILPLYKGFNIALIALLSFASFSRSHAQNYTFNYNNNGRRVCLVDAEVDMMVPSATIRLLDASSNTANTTDIYRRPLYGNGSAWVQVATALPAGTTSWTDLNVNAGEIWEYQVKRTATWTYNGSTYDATGYTIASLLKDNSNYRGQLILLVATNVVDSLPAKYTRLKKELTADGWYVNEVSVAPATGWDSGDTVVSVKNQVSAVYNNAPSTDKPKILFILGHVPMPRSGSTSITAPDAHDQDKGARGCDGYYADIDGIFTDVATFDPGNLATPLAVNLPGDYKWDQDFFPSELEMAFGRVDFKDITTSTLTEMQLIEQYLDRASNYKNVAAGFDMGDKSAFYYGYDNSNDGAYRSLPDISKSENVYQNNVGAPHPAWVAANGPFKVYMQNVTFPEIGEWVTNGMNATVYTSDQSYWGFNDEPQSFYYSRIRALLGVNSKCLITLWTTSAVNTFHQACMGDALGLAVKQTMDYNNANNNVERAPQQWDTPDWWNRTHLSFNGDPTVRLYQMQPPANLAIAATINDDAGLTWAASADADLVGYHIYKSGVELGKYERITTTPVTALSYIDTGYHQNDWYMVRAIKTEESGCGKFLDPSLGIFVQGTFPVTTGVESLVKAANVQLYPNPASTEFTIVSANDINSVTLTNAPGQVVLVKENINSRNVTLSISTLTTGIYFANIKTESGAIINKLIQIK